MVNNMKHLKLYENFNISSDYSLANQLLNDDVFMRKSMNFINSLPNKFKNILKEFFSQKKIDVDKLYKIEKRFNIFNKVKNLYDKGIRDINEIIDRIFPKNESSFLVVLFAIIIMAFVIFVAVIGWIKISDWFDNRDKGGLGFILGLLWALLVVGGFFVGIFALDDSTPEEKLKGKEEEISDIIIDTGIKKDTVILIKDKDGKYKLQLDESDW
jgi:hypothetical protein